jgi:hypothetical protein
VRTLVICGLVVVLGVGVGSVGKVAGADCTDRFPEGRFGISPSRPVVAKLVVPEFSPLYLAKRALSLARPEDCRYVYTTDVFRMTDLPAPGTLLAGCVGDFDGDGRADVALLMRRARDVAVAAFVFEARGTSYQVAQIEGITDPYGFAEDKNVWPGPFCIPKPPSGVFTEAVDGQKINVVGDLFTIGWKTYFWNPATRRFEAVLTSD